LDTPQRRPRTIAPACAERRVTYQAMFRLWSTRWSARGSSAPTPTDRQPLARGRPTAVQVRPPTEHDSRRWRQPLARRSSHPVRQARRGQLSSENTGGRGGTRTPDICLVRTPRTSPPGDMHPSRGHVALGKTPWVAGMLAKCWHAVADGHVADRRLISARTCRRNRDVVGQRVVWHRPDLAGRVVTTLRFDVAADHLQARGDSVGAGYRELPAGGQRVPMAVTTQCRDPEEGSGGAMLAAETAVGTTAVGPALCARVL
jgi:hypothetical protein